MGTRVRRSDRQAKAHTSMGMVLGNEAEAQMSRHLTVLRVLCRWAQPPRPAPQIVGIDDWAWRRRRYFGTIICDLERRRVIKLLPGRSSEAVAHQRATASAPRWSAVTGRARVPT